MGVLNLFSKREELQAKQGITDVLQYDSLPETFRVQVVHIWMDSLGNGSPSYHLSSQWWGEIYKAYICEKGKFCLTHHQQRPADQCCNYFLKASREDALDLIELTFQSIKRKVSRYDSAQLSYHGGIITTPNEAIAELNHRFMEHGIGYEFAGGELIRKDSQFIHAQAVKPALALMQDAGAGFSGPLQEFLDAHQRYRRGEMEDAIVWAGKSFESTLKAICDARSWRYEKGKATTSDLVAVVLAKGLIPTWLTDHFAGLRKVLETGLANVRNKSAAHGAGATPIPTPEHMARYALNLAASNIVFLIECHNDLP